MNCSIGEGMGEGMTIGNRGRGGGQDGAVCNEGSVMCDVPWCITPADPAIETIEDVEDRGGTYRYSLALAAVHESPILETLLRTGCVSV